MRNRYIVNARGIDFHLFFRKGSNTVLHIADRHQTTAEEAIEAYFEGTSAYDEDHNRFETTTDRRAVLWNWIDPDKSVYIITCVRRGHG